MRIALVILAGLMVMAAAPADYGVRLPVQMAPGAPFQRIELPPGALAASQSPDLADVRVFDGEGRSMAVARAGSAPEAMVTHDMALKPLPIMGTPGALNVTGVSLKIEAGETRVVRVDGNVQPGGATVLGVMFDTRLLADPARKLLLDADLPPRQPVTFRIESSPDLRLWQPVTEAVFYSDPDRKAAPALDLGGIALKGHYLRLTWSTTSRPISPVVIHGATLRSGQAGAAGPGPMVDIAARRDSAHRLSLALPFATPVQMLSIEPAGDNVLVPVRILGRNDREQPWTLLGQGTAYRLQKDGRPEFGPPIRLLASARLLMIEGDERTAGFAVAPRIRLGFAPVSIIVLVQGTPPYVLAVGRAKASSALLPIETMIPAYEPESEYALPLAAVTTSAGSVVGAAAAEPGVDSRQILLWAVLIGATAVLAGLVWLLRRGTRP
jgi:hypothetical protein